MLLLMLKAVMVKT
ncbi:hypothetical protein MXB_5578 [Myxobolus squamalis]|nr:hypothetical protein MXB_5578 [Myxobolus squamalis]